MKKTFKKNGFQVVPNFISQEVIGILKNYFDIEYQLYLFHKARGVDKNKMRHHSSIETGDVANSIGGFYGDSFIEAINLTYMRKVSEVIETDILPTYTNSRIYEKGDYLIPHKDRVSCEISLTIPIFSSDNSPSTIYISNYNVRNYNFRPTFEQVEDQENYTKVDLLPGDALFYRGTDYFHWRKPLEADYLYQFFMHYVEQNGKYTEFKYDKRPYMGFPANTKFYR